jgi:hypothetical protein
MICPNSLAQEKAERLRSPYPPLREADRHPKGRDASWRLRELDERQSAWCIHCSAPLTSVDRNRDHVPSKTLLVKPYPANLPVVAVCARCNNGFSRDEEYIAALLGSVLAGSTDPADPRNPAAEILARSPKLRSRIEQCRKEHKTADDETEIVWAPELDRINRVVVKNARGHAFHEYGEPMLEEPSGVATVP